MQVEQSRIVVGLDGSVQAQDAVRYALAEAAQRGARVEVVRAFLPPDPAGTLDYCVFGAPTIAQVTAGIESSGRQVVQRIVAEAGATADLPAVPFDVVALVGRPAKVLLQRARGADLLVLGHSGRGAIASAVLGSVGLQCLLHAPCPVMIVRPAAPAPAQVAAG